MEYLYKGLRRSIYDSEPLQQALARKLGLSGIDRVIVDREALDARRKTNLVHVYNLRFSIDSANPRLEALLAGGKVVPYRPKPLPEATPRIRLPERPLIVGFGPAGMFAGLFLARMGYKPIIYERGQPVGERIRAIDRLWSEGILNPESNMQFGEGGAGTFSDGKLTTGKTSSLDRLILDVFVHAGAPESILFSHKPHIGTDHLRKVVVNVRGEIEALGGEVHFDSRLADVHVESGAVRGATVSGERVDADCLILAIGHSARETALMLEARGVAMQPKPFAIGTRIEHPAAFINEAQYGDAARGLPAADYKLSYRHHERGIYSFCMCPGGQVVCTSSQVGGQVTNGMSNYARDGAYSNSALVVGLNPTELGIDSPTVAIGFLRELEERAYQAGGGRYQAPAQRAPDFFKNQGSRHLPTTTYRPGVSGARLDTVLPDFVVSALKAGLRHFDRRMPGFVSQGVLIGLESRTSSPVRILRDENCCSVSTRGLYLLGEGAGYAGGIMTCARDAVQFARSVVAWS